MAKVFVITGPSGVGKGTLIAELLRAGSRASSSRSRRRRAQPREGEEDGRDYHFLTPEEFDRRVEAERLPRVRHLQRQPLRHAALRGRAAPRRRPLGGARDRGPGRPPGAGGDAASRSRSSSPRPTPPRCGERLESRGTDSLEAIDARLEVAEQELAAQDEFDHRVVNDDLERAAGELEGIVRAELGIPLDSAADDQTTR